MRLRRLVPLAALAALAGCGDRAAREHATLAVTPARALLDAPVHVRVGGLGPGRHVSLEASTVDAGGTSWTATESLVADRAGVVDRDAGELLWGMRPASGAARVLAAPRGGLRVRFRLAGSGRVLAAGRQLRVGSTAVVRRLRPGATGLYGSYYEPTNGRGRRPAVLTLGGSGGGLSTGALSSLLAAHGYPSLALAYFKEPGLPRALRRIPLEYFVRALRWLARRPGVDPRRIVVLGVSRGSEAALLLAAGFPAVVRGVVGYVPSSYVHAAPDPAQRSWTLRGRPLRTGLPIAVARIRGPILVLSAERDTVWPSSAYARLIARRSGAEWHDFRAAGHLLGSALPYAAYVCPRDRCPAGGTEAGNAEARVAAWSALLRFLAAV
jgi:dienelactone hydrolase